MLSEEPALSLVGRVVQFFDHEASTWKKLLVAPAISPHARTASTRHAATSQGLTQGASIVSHE